MASTQPDRERIVDHLRRELEAEPEVVLAVLHGSFAHGGGYRDIDVAVWLDPVQVPESARFRHALDLSVRLAIALGRPVDVRALNDASLAFRYQALRGRPLLTRDEGLLDDLRERTWDAYCDFAPFARRYLREALDA